MSLTTQQKQLILLKLSSLYEQLPEFGEYAIYDTKSKQMMWIAAAGALVRKANFVEGANFEAARRQMFLNYQWVDGIRVALSAVANVIEDLKLELELDGKNEIGTIYSAGSEFEYYKDLRKVFSSATSEVFIVDPYFGEEAFAEYFSSFEMNCQIRIISQGRQANELEPYIAKHQKQYSSRINLRTSKKPHDRVVFIDNQDGWITGGSVKDGGLKPSYLMPVHPSLVADKLGLYNEIWANAAVLV